jgi:hypothetical protein
MHIACKVLLATPMVVAAIAFAAGTASAQETPVEFETEAGAPCNPCVVHIEGESHIRNLFQPGQPIVSRCHDDLNARLYHNGSGEIEWLGLHHDDTFSCIVTNCSSTPFEDHWPIVLADEQADGSAHMTWRFCFTNLHCNGGVHVTEPTSHSYHFSMQQLCFGGAYVVEGEWTSEGHQNFEIDHTPGD